MSEAERGQVRNRARAEQGRDFTGLRFGNITPTDIDGFIEFRNKAFVMIEAKLPGASFPLGQQKALARAVDAFQDAGKDALLLVAEHDTPLERQIDMAQTMVRRYYTNGTWRDLTPAKTTRYVVMCFLKHIGLWHGDLAA